MGEHLKMAVADDSPNHAEDLRLAAMLC